MWHPLQAVKFHSSTVVDTATYCTTLPRCAAACCLNVISLTPVCVVPLLGKISQFVFGVCFNEGATSNGTITLGGVDPALYIGTIQYSPNTGGGMYG